MTQPTLVGLLGESSNDTNSLQALLNQRYGKRVRFVDLMPPDGRPKITGSQLDNPKLQHVIRANYRFQKPWLVVVTRDLDAPWTDRAKRLERLLFFRKMNKGFERKGIHLLNVEAMEALICADIAVFNNRYQCNCVVPDDPTTIHDPVKFLKAATRPGQPHYDEGHCADLLGKVAYDTLLANCRYFAAFDAEFSQRLPAVA